MWHTSVASFEEGYQAAGATAALLDLGDWTKIEVAGKDAVPFLHNFCTGDIKSLSDGEGLEAFVTNVKARVVAHVLIYRRDAQSLKLLTAPGQAPGLIQHLDRYIITEDVALEDQSRSRGLLGLVGPSAEQRLQALGAAVPEAAGAHRLATARVEINGVAAQLASFDGLKQPAWLIETPSESIPVVGEVLAAAGAIPAGLEVLNSLRIEAVFPLSGSDVTEEHLAPEVDRPWAISLTKGCYLGQEPIARIDARGHVNRLLRGLRLDEEIVPESGSFVADGEKTVGEVRSSATSGSDGKVIALAFLRASHAAEGTKVTVRSGEIESGATVYGGASQTP